MRDFEQYAKVVSTNKEAQKAKSVAYKKNQGKVPAYLQRYRKEEEQEN